MKIIVNIQLKEGVLDPQGKAVHHALSSLKFNEVQEVRIGKQIILDINEMDKNSAQKRVEVMCEELLANTVIENYTIEFPTC
ncbi:MAG: phosphoribosylformylglycinamidine synthase subunit PurS [Campylobacteraceae bacterium]|nr:phosphoribosylformylglycinamidine synthase subunit PurS [Campylobacteraceae bacterium]